MRAGVTGGGPRRGSWEGAARGGPRSGSWEGAARAGGAGRGYRGWSAVGFLGRGSGVRGGDRARVAGLAPLPASARESARLPSPPGGAAGAPRVGPTRRGLAASPTSTTCSASRSGWVPGARRGEAADVRRAPGLARRARPRAWAGRGCEGRGAGRAREAPGRRGVAASGAPRPFPGPPAAAGWRRTPGGRAERAAGRGWGRGREPNRVAASSGQAAFACLGGCWCVPRR